MPSYDFKCGDCGHQDIFILSYEDRDKERRCNKCGDFMIRFYAKMPGVTKASYIDSNKTARAKEMADMKQAAKLESEAGNLDKSSQEYRETKKAIRELKSIKK